MGKAGQLQNSKLDGQHISKISVTIRNVNGLKSSIKKQCQSE